MHSFLKITKEKKKRYAPLGLLCREKYKKWRMKPDSSMLTHLAQKEQMNKQIFRISIKFKNARNIRKILLCFLNQLIFQNPLASSFCSFCVR
jgi:hypothetical protein